MKSCGTESSVNNSSNFCNKNENQENDNDLKLNNLKIFTSGLLAASNLIVSSISAFLALFRSSLLFINFASP